MKLAQNVLLFLLSLTFSSVSAQNFKVLHYSETSGYDHQTRQNSLAMVQNMGNQNGFTVDDDQTGSAFNSVANLQQYEVVIFANTSGNQILDSAQRANFEAYIQQGGSLLGIHAATDTYRHSTANSSNTGKWDFYAETLGGSVQRNPNHTAAGFSGTLDVQQNHLSTDNIPDPWNKSEEYYYWGNGYLNPANQEVLRVRSTGSQSYDTARAVSWYQNLNGGGRSFYTSLGHANRNYTSDTAFQNHIRDALLWAAGQTVSLAENSPVSDYELYPVPAQEQLIIDGIKVKGNLHYEIHNLAGQTLQKGSLVANDTPVSLAVTSLSKGSYFLILGKENKRLTSLHFTVTN